MISQKIKNLKLAVVLFVYFLFVVVTAINFTSCCAYSFTGASVPQHLKTIAIPIADDRSGAAEQNLRENLTQKLIQRFIDDNTLQVAERTNANAVLECTVISVLDNPAIVSAGESVTSRRVTIAVKVVYRDLVKRATVFDKTFTKYSDYPSANPVEGRKKAVEETLDLLTDEILLDTVSGW